MLPGNIPDRMMRRRVYQITVPTMFVWGDDDVPIVQQRVQHLSGA